MEPQLLRWHAAEDTSHTQLHLAIREQLPEPLRAFLKAQLPQAIETAHDQVLRDPTMLRSWIATQQNFQRETLEILRTLQAPAPKPTGKVWAIPSPTRNFQDRPELIAKIDQSRLQHRTAALTALHGMGGIGKSQLARRFTEQHQDQYAIGGWLEAESDASLYAALGTVGRQLGLPDEPNQQTYALRIQASRPIAPTSRSSCATWVSTKRPTNRSHSPSPPNWANSPPIIPPSPSVAETSPRPYTTSATSPAPSERST